MTEPHWVNLSVMACIGLLSVVGWAMLLYKGLQYRKLLTEGDSLGRGHILNQVRMMQGLELISAIGTALPLLGLLGTVLGLKHAFAQMSAISTNTFACFDDLSDKRVLVGA